MSETKEVCPVCGKKAVLEPNWCDACEEAFEEADGDQLSFPEALSWAATRAREAERARLTKGKATKR